MAEWKIEPMTPADVDEVWKISQTASMMSPWTRTMFEQEFRIPMSNFMVVKDPDIVGYGGFWKMGDDAHIIHLAVTPSRRRQGMGSFILSHLITECRRAGLRRALLEVHADNTAAQGLYGKFGFSKIGIRAGYYGPGADAVVLEKML